MNLERLAINKFRKIIIEMSKGYPAYVYSGLFEKEFKENFEIIINKFKGEGIIEVSRDNEKDEYRYNLTKKGIDLAISMINLDNSEKMIEYSKEMRKFTIAIIFLTMLTFGLGLLTFIIQL